MLAGKNGGQIYSRTNETKAVRGPDGLVEHKSNIVAKCGRVDGDYGVPQSKIVGQNRIIPFVLRLSIAVVLLPQRLQVGQEHGSFRNRFSKRSIKFPYPV
jgi:hypothetical protein